MAVTAPTTNIIDLRAVRLARHGKRPTPTPDAPTPEMELLTALLDTLSERRTGFFYKVCERLREAARPGADAAINGYFNVRVLNHRAGAV